MIRSMVLLGALVVVVVFAGRALVDYPSEEPRAVDYQQIAGQVRDGASFAVLAPRSLPQGGQATSATYEPGVQGGRHRGVLTGDQEYIGVEQTPMSKRSAVEEFAAESTAQEQARVGGHRWQVRSSGDGETTFVRRRTGVTVLVTGSAPRAQIEAFITSLR